MRKTALMASTAVFLAVPGLAIAAEVPVSARPTGSMYDSGPAYGPAELQTDMNRVPGSRSSSPTSPLAAPGGPFPIELKGTALVDTAGHKIGDIEDVSGDKLIVRVGSHLGMGEKTVALSLGQVKIGGPEAMAMISREQLAAQPQWTAPRPPASSSARVTPPTSLTGSGYR